MNGSWLTRIEGRMPEDGEAWIARILAVLQAIPPGPARRAMWFHSLAVGNHHARAREAAGESDVETETSEARLAAMKTHIDSLSDDALADMLMTELLQVAANHGEPGACHQPGCKWDKYEPAVRTPKGRSGPQV